MTVSLAHVEVVEHLTVNSYFDIIIVLLALNFFMVYNLHDMDQDFSGPATLVVKGCVNDVRTSYRDL